MPNDMTQSEDEKLHNVSDNILFYKTKLLLETLSKNYTPKTKFQEVMPGTMRVKFAITDFSVDPNVYGVPETIKTIEVELIPFFGMHVGYCRESDTILLWRD